MRGRDKRIIKEIFRGIMLSMLGVQTHTVRDQHGRVIATIETFDHRRTR